MASIPGQGSSVHEHPVEAAVTSSGKTTPAAALHISVALQSGNAAPNTSCSHVGTSLSAAMKQDPSSTTTTTMQGLSTPPSVGFAANSSAMPGCILLAPFKLSKVCTHSRSPRNVPPFEPLSSNLPALLLPD